MEPRNLKYTSVTCMDAVAVIRPKRRLLGGEETHEFQELVSELNAQNLRCLVIDLAAIDFVNSPGLSALFDAHQRFAKRGARVHLAGLDRRVHNMLAITRLLLVFDVYSTEEAALAGALGESAPRLVLLESAHAEVGSGRPSHAEERLLG
jgi:anti-sigma B factor antagonist